MTTHSCSHWWHCPVYLAMSITLASIVISSVKHSEPLSLSSNASLALRSNNFSSFSSLLHSNPQLFSPHSTFFAIPDYPLSQFHSRPLFLKQLLNRHSVPRKLSFKDLMNMPQGTCFHTLQENMQIAITKTGKNERLEISHVAVTHPDLFLAGAVAIHGVSGPFASGEITKLPLLSTVRFLSSKGYVSFGVGLNSVLEDVIQENPDLGSATVFAPMDFAFVSSSWGLLGEIVRYHIVPGRLVYADLDDKLVLKTLDSDRKLVISVEGSTDRKLRINGVEIIAPNAYLSEKIVIHGISRAFTLEELPSTSL